MMQGPWFWEELSAMADALSAKFSIVNIVGMTRRRLSEKTVQLLITSIENQEEQIRLNFSYLSLDWLSENEKIFLTLVNEKCKEWTVKTLQLHLDGLDLLLKLDNCHISHLHFHVAVRHSLWNQLDKFKQVWMKVEKFSFRNITTGGGRGGNPETDWQQFLDHLTT